MIMNENYKLVKKIFKKAIFVCLINLLLTTVVFADENLSRAGLVFYKQGNYEKALEFLSDAVKDDPGNVEVLYYFANALVKTHNVDYAQKYYQKVITIDPNSQWADYSKQALSYIAEDKAKIKVPLNSSMVKNQELYSYSNSYIQNITYNGEVVHWSKDKMPLNVYITPPSYREHLQPVVDAFKEWQNSSQGLVFFNKVNTENTAQIIVKWKKRLTANENTDFGGYSLPNISNNELIRYNIYLSELDSNKKLILPNEIYMAALHQIGHSLGLSSHSNNKEDLMYPKGNEGKITKRDKSTLFWLYDREPDISDFSRVTPKVQGEEKEEDINKKQEDEETAKPKEESKIKRPRKHKKE